MATLKASERAALEQLSDRQLFDIIHANRRARRVNRALAREAAEAEDILRGRHFLRKIEREAIR